MKLNVPRLVLANLILLAMTLTLLVAGFIGGYLFIDAIAKDRTPARAAVVTLRSVPPKELLCPGSDLNYIFAVKQLRAPIIARIARTVVSSDRDKTIVGQKAEDVELRIWLTLDGFEQRDNFHLPKLDDEGKPIPPGMYELRIAVGAEGAAPTAFALPFKVTRCPS